MKQYLNYEKMYQVVRRDSINKCAVYAGGAADFHEFREFILANPLPPCNNTIRHKCWSVKKKLLKTEKKY